MDGGWGRWTGGGGTYARFYIDKYIMTRCTLLLPRTETYVVFFYSNYLDGGFFLLLYVFVPFQPRPSPLPLPSLLFKSKPQSLIPPCASSLSFLSFLSMQTLSLKIWV